MQLFRVGQTRAKALQTVRRFPRETHRRYAASKSNGFFLLFREMYIDLNGLVIYGCFIDSLGNILTILIPEQEKMKKHSHNHVETYDGLAGLGLDRETDENTIIYYLQKFSDDTLIKELVKRLTDEELEEIFSLLTRLLRKHLTDSEYHTLFLKDDHQ